MDEKITAIGAAVLLVSIALFFGYLPLIGESADDISDDYENGNFEGYDTADRVTIYGKVSDIEYMKAWDLTKVVLDGEDDVPIYVEGNYTSSIEKGDRVYIKCFIDDFRILGQNVEYLRAHQDDVHQTIWLNVTFIIVAAAGAVVLVVGIRRI